MLLRAVPDSCGASAVRCVLQDSPQPEQCLTAASAVQRHRAQHTALQHTVLRLQAVAPLISVELSH